MGYVRTGDDMERQNVTSETIYHAPGERTVVRDERASSMEPDRHEQKVTSEVVAGGSSLEAIGGAGAIVLAIIGLAAYMPLTLCAIAVIAAGGGLLIHGAAMAARWHRALQGLDEDRYAKFGFEGGLGTEVLGGAAGVALGIIALAGVAPHVLLPIAAIVFGGSLLLGGAAAPEVDKIAPSRGRFGHEAVQASGGLMVLAGLAAATLGIIGLIIANTFVTLTLIAMLCVGGALLLAGGALTARFARRFA